MKKRKINKKILKLSMISSVIIPSAIIPLAKSLSCGDSLEDQKEKYKKIIYNIDSPSKDNKNHSFAEFILIDKAKSCAYKAISLANNWYKAKKIFEEQKSIVEKRILDYKNSTGTIQAKKNALNEIQLINLEKDDELHNSNEYLKFTKTKKLSIQTIKDINLDLDSSNLDYINVVFNKQKKLLEKIIQNYKNSTGTIKAKKDAKQEIIKIFAQVERNDAEHSSLKYQDLKKIKEVSIEKIDAIDTKKTNLQEIKEILDAQKKLINNAKEAYTKSTGTIQAKKDAKKEIIKIFAQVQRNDLEHSSLKYLEFQKIKEDAIKTINDIDAKTTDLQKIQQILDQQKGLINNAKEAYTKSTGITKENENIETVKKIIEQSFKKGTFLIKKDTKPVISDILKKLGFSGIDDTKFKNLIVKMNVSFDLSNLKKEKPIIFKISSNLPNTKTVDTKILNIKWWYTDRFIKNYFQTTISEAISKMQIEYNVDSVEDIKKHLIQDVKNKLKKEEKEKFNLFKNYLLNDSEWSLRINNAFINNMTLGMHYDDNVCVFIAHNNTNFASPKLKKVFWKNYSDLKMISEVKQIFKNNYWMGKEQRTQRPAIQLNHKNLIDYLFKQSSNLKDLLSRGWTLDHKWNESGHSVEVYLKDTHGILKTSITIVSISQ